MMEAAPAAPLEVPEPDLLLEFKIVTFDTPAQLGQVDEFAEADIGWQRRQPILRVSERMCKQVSVSLPYRGDSHDDRHDDYARAAGQLLANYEKPEDLTGADGLF